MSVFQYKVKASDGREYGPVDLATLQEWVRQGRVTHDSKVRNLGNGMLLQASNMPELDGFFPGLGGRQATAMAAGLVNAQNAKPADHWEDYKFVVVMSILGIALSLVISWFAAIFCIVGMVRAWQAAKEHKPYSGLAFAIALFSLFASLAIPFMMMTWMENILKGFFGSSSGKRTFDR